MPHPFRLSPMRAIAMAAALSTSGAALAQSSLSPDASPPSPAAVATQPATPFGDRQAVLDALTALGGQPMVAFDHGLKPAR